MTGMTRTRIARVYRASMQAVALLANLVLVSIVLVVLCSVAVRYFGVFQGSLDWATEYSRFAIVWVVMLGSTMALDRGAHVGIDFSPVIPASMHRPVRTLAAMLGFLFVAVLAWQGFVLCLATTRQISPAMGVPMSAGYLAIPVGASIMAVQCILFACFPELTSRWSPLESEAVGAAD
jgi:TRAP-type C4-dicarboxylate transport system permease small subunit